jgi:hypothetical protein
VAPALIWEHSWDGVDLNSLVSPGYSTHVAEAMQGAGQAMLSTEMQASLPVPNRQQPLAGRYTFLCQPIATTDVLYQSLMAELRAITGPGPHSWVFRAPGEETAHTVEVWVDGPMSIDDSMYGVATWRAVAHTPPY